MFCIISSKNVNSCFVLTWLLRESHLFQLYNRSLSIVFYSILYNTYPYVLSLCGHC